MPVHLEEIRVNVKGDEYFGTDKAWHSLSELTDAGWVQVGGVMPSARFLDEFVMWFQYKPDECTAPEEK